MPLGADRMQIADHAPLDPVLRLPVLDVVVPLVADRQIEFLSFAVRAISLHWLTSWAMSFSVMTCSPWFIAAMAIGACRCSGVAMMIASMPSAFALSKSSWYGP